MRVFLNHLTYHRVPQMYSLIEYVTFASEQRIRLNTTLILTVHLHERRHWQVE